MPQPPQDGDILFEDLWQDLPPETVHMAREFKAFTRGRKVKTPVQLLRLVLLSCGLDQSLREVAAHVSLLEEGITASAVAARLVACRPWVRAVLARMVPPPPPCPCSGAFWSSMRVVFKLRGLAARRTGGTCVWPWSR